MEKSKFLLFLSLPLLLTSCSNPGTISKNSLTSSSDENEIKTANILLNFVFEHVYDSEDNLPLASLLYQSNYLSDDFDELEIPQDLIAGDLLNIEYTGEIIATESYPGTFYLNGEIISYNFEKTKIIEIDIKEDLLTIENLSQSYILENEYVRDNLNISRNTASKYLHSLSEIGILMEEKVGKEIIYKNSYLYDLIKTW